MSSNSVLRRYTPPTCSLEISAKDSPLSRWMGQSVLKHLRFKLSFDDPRVSEENWMTVRGDRAQLEALCEVVTAYVQQFLNQSMSLLSATGLQGSHTSNTAGANSNVSSLDNYASTLGILSPPAPSGTSEPVAANASSFGLFIQPKGILSHELFLGKLAAEESNASICLSAVQLADLATALDEYAADVTALPNLNRPAWTKNPPKWTSLAAASLITIGLSTSVLRLLDRSASNSETAPTSSQGASSSDQRLALQPLPNNSAPSPLPTVPGSPPPLSSIPNLPPPTVAPSPSSAGLPRIPVPSTSEAVPDRPQIVELPEGAVPVNPIPSQSRSADAPQDPTPPSVASAKVRQAPSAKSESETAEQTAISAATARGSAASRSSATRETAFDTIPQVAEVRKYFQQRWTPPQELSQTLEYRLVLSPQGSIQQITPLGQTAGDFIDRTGMPLVGEPFVSASKSGRSAVIRVVLDPDGRVQTFDESGNEQ